MLRAQVNFEKKVTVWDVVMPKKEDQPGDSKESDLTSDDLNFQVLDKETESEIATRNKLAHDEILENSSHQEKIHQEVDVLIMPTSVNTDVHDSVDPDKHYKSQSYLHPRDDRLENNNFEC